MSLLSKPVIYALGVALLLALLWGGWQWRGKHAALRDADNATAALLTFKAEVATLAAAAERDSADREAKARRALDAERQDREQEKANAEREKDRLVADLRAGNQRLRNEWQGCPRQVPDHAQPGPVADEGAELRSQGAGDLIAAGDDADRQVRGLQAYARACLALAGE